MVTGWIGGFGNVRPGIAAPANLRTRSDLCAQHGHPGATYNPWSRKTWCLCGQVIRVGGHFEHVACCGGPLVEYLESDGQYRARTETELAA